MTISQSLLPEYDQEMSNTRRVLERVPEDKFSWKPHEKSMDLRHLSRHIAEIPGWIHITVVQDSIDVAPVDGPAYVPPSIQSRADLLSLFDNNVVEGRQSLAGASDECMHENWTLLAGGKPIFTMPRGACIRTWGLSHLVHHRAQLGVYLRLNEIPVPSIYGPSADEGAM